MGGLSRGSACHLCPAVWRLTRGRRPHSFCRRGAGSNGGNGKRPVPGKPSAAGGHLDICVLGGYQVSARGDLANWHTGRPDDIPAVRGAMDLALGAKQTFVMMRLLARDGSAKLVRECTYPLTGVGCVSRVYTDLAVLLIGENGVAVRELFGIAPDRLQDLLNIPLVDRTAPSEGPEVTLEQSPA